jgi:hypothetical protein
METDSQIVDVDNNQSTQKLSKMQIQNTEEIKNTEEIQNKENINNDAQNISVNNLNNINNVNNVNNDINQKNKNQLNKSRNPSNNKFIWLIYIPIIGLFTYLIRQSRDIFHMISMMIALFFTIYTIHTNFFKPYHTVEDDINSDNLIEGFIKKSLFNNITYCKCS